MIQTNQIDDISLDYGLDVNVLSAFRLSQTLKKKKKPQQQAHPTPPGQECRS